MHKIDLKEHRLNSKAIALCGLHTNFASPRQPLYGFSIRVAVMVALIAGGQLATENRARGQNNSSGQFQPAIMPPRVPASLAPQLGGALLTPPSASMVPNRVTSNPQPSGVESTRFNGPCRVSAITGTHVHGVPPPETHARTTAQPKLSQSIPIATQPGPHRCQRTTFGARAPSQPVAIAPSHSL